MSVIDIRDADHFAKEINHGGLVVIDFWAQFCGPCRRLAPEYKELAKKYPHVKFLKVGTVPKCLVLYIFVG